MSRTRLLSIGAGLAGIGLVSAGVIATGDAAPAPIQVRHEVQMRAVSFAPRALTVRLGDTVTFRNADIVRHNAVRRDVFDTGSLKAGESYSWVPADTGSYRYQCTIHPRMRGEIRVNTAAAPAP